MSDQPPARQPHRSHWLHRAAFLLTVAAVVFGLAGFTLYRDQQRLRERASTTTQNIAALLDQSIASMLQEKIRQEGGSLKRTFRGRTVETKIVR